MLFFHTFLGTEGLEKMFAVRFGTHSCDCPPAQAIPQSQGEAGTLPQSCGHAWVPPPRAGQWGPQRVALDGDGSQTGRA